MKTVETFDCEQSIANATEQFKRITDYVRGEAQTQDAYAVERRLFKDRMKLAVPAENSVLVDTKALTFLLKNRVHCRITPFRKRTEVH